MRVVRALAHGELFIVLLTHNFSNMKIFGRHRYWMLQCQKIIEKMEQMRDPLMFKQWEPCGYRWHTEPRYRAMRGHRLNGFRERNRLCIDCVRYGTTTTNQIHRTNSCATKQGKAPWEY